MATRTWPIGWKGRTNRARSRVELLKVRHEESVRRRIEFRQLE
jgi:hypothetical protein